MLFKMNKSFDIFRESLKNNYEIFNEYRVQQYKRPTVFRRPGLETLDQVWEEVKTWKVRTGGVPYQWWQYYNHL